MTISQKQYGIFSLPVIVGALGFFVDVYDLLLFSIIRKPSLQALHLSAEEVLSKGELIISVQMIGLLLGGIIWGIMGDKKGRLSVLFGSIILYSLANLANGMVQTVPQYVLMRFLAGIGLAGELGASITLVSEMLPKEKRGLAASVIASVGVCGVVRGNFLMLFNNRNRFLRYVKGVLIGLPVWYVIGILITFSDKFGNEFGIAGVDPGKAIMFQYIAIGLGDLSAGLLSNYLKSRKKALYIFFCILSFFVILFFLQGNGRGSLQTMYLLCGGLGFGAGFSILYITMSAEQFGTNLRASTAISIPNVVRGILPLIILLHRGLRALTGNYVTGGWITGIIIMIMAVIAAYHTRETFGLDMNYLEE